MRRSLRSLLLLLASGLAALAGCDPDPEDAAAPPGGPPPAGFATEMVAAHDAVRAGARPVPAPPLPALGWSDAVARTAQAWADGCSYRHNPDLRTLSLGENIAATAPPGARTAADVVALWASEAPYYDLASNTCVTTNPPNPWGTCGHYTQLVWRSTTAIGCAVATCSTGSPFEGVTAWEFWVCDYAPPGNFVGERPY